MNNIKSKFLFIFILLLTLICTLTLSACGDVTDKINELYNSQKKAPVQEEEEEEECDHEFQQVSEIKSTCVTHGYVLYKCIKCGETERTELPLGNHTFINGEIVCSVCGAYSPPLYSYPDKSNSSYGTAATAAIYNAPGGNGYRLMLTGSGTFSSIPWRDYQSEIRVVTIEGKVNLPDGAFENNTMLDTVSGSGNFTSIGKRAFYGCTSLKTIALSEGVVSIGDEAFAGCEYLANAVLPNSLERMGKNAFADCIRLLYLTLPFAGSGDKEGSSVLFGSIFSSTDETNYNQFYENEQGEKEYFLTPGMLKEVTLTKEETICSYAFSNWSYELETLNLPSVVKKIDAYAFYKNSGLQKLNLPDNSGLIEIGRNAFDSCSSLTEFTLPSGVSVIEAQTFIRCTAMEKFVFADGSALREIAADAFKYCSSLRSVILPETVETIGMDAFRYCSGMEKVRLNKNIISIGVNAFYGCSSLNDVYFICNVETLGNNESGLLGEGNSFHLWLEESVSMSNQLSYVYNNFYSNNSTYIEQVDGYNYRLWLRKK